MPPIKVYRGRPHLPNPEKVFAQRPRSDDLDNETALEKSRRWNLWARDHNRFLERTNSFLFPLQTYEAKHLNVTQSCSPMGLLLLNRKHIEDLLVNIYGPDTFEGTKFDEYDVEELRYCLCRTYGLSMLDWHQLIKAELSIRHLNELQSTH